MRKTDCNREKKRERRFDPDIFLKGPPGEGFVIAVQFRAYLFPPKSGGH